MFFLKKIAHGKIHLLRKEGVPRSVSKYLFVSRKYLRLRGGLGARAALNIWVFIICVLPTNGGGTRGSVVCTPRTKFDYLLTNLRILNFDVLSVGEGMGSKESGN